MWSDNLGATTKATTDSAGVNSDATGTSGETDPTDATTVPTGGDETATPPTGGELPTVTCAPLPAGVVGVECEL
ncbi:MAG TPA: hypothetical protein VGB85_27105 [Nannocystis sp.]